MEKTKRNTIQKSFISLDEASVYLGIKKSTLYSYTHNRIIPFYKPRRKIYFKIEDLDNFVLNETNHCKSTTEIEAEALNHHLANSK